MSPPEAHRLASLMCAVTEQVLWHPASEWVRERVPGSTLRCRVGSGQATYHRFDARIQQHQITYGMRMVAAKQRADTASGWLSCREIRTRGYFGGELSTLNLLAHTCCHEFAHLLQHSAGQRYYGSVHNRHFYTILDELHENGHADAARQVLKNLATDSKTPLSAMPFQLPDPTSPSSHWQVDEPVIFGSGTQEFHGEIVRVNRKTCTVDGTGQFHGMRYRVPISMLRRRR